MKKAIALLLCGLTLALVACKDDAGTSAGVEFRFAEPTVSDVSGTVASVNCTVLSFDGALESIPLGFLFGPGSESVGNYAEAPNVVRGEGSISCRLTGLDPATAYKVLAYADLDGRRVVSLAATFTTLEVNPDIPTLEITSLTSLSVDAEADIYTITYQVTNSVQDATAEASSQSAWLNTFDNSTEGEISFIVDANPEAERTGVIQVSYPGAESREVTVVQKVAEHKPVLAITSQTTVVATAAEDDYTITYRVTDPTTGVKAVATSGASWLESFNNTEDGKITFVARENAGAKRTGIVVVSYTGAESRQVTINQEAGAGGGEEGKVIELTPESGLPSSYGKSTVTLGEYEYSLTDVAKFNTTNGIQFKSGSGLMYNMDDMGAINRVEIMLASKASGTKFALYVGDSQQPAGSEIKPVVTDQMNYAYDCSLTSGHYFKLSNGAGAAYIRSIKIYTGEGGVTPPNPGEPVFEAPAYSDVTKNSATISCSYTYTGDGAISEAYFLYRTSTGSDIRLDQTATPGAKSASLTGLASSTLYTFRLCVVLDGKTYTSGSSTFVTNNEQGQPSGETYKSGWAELPIEISNPDYYYAHHICPTFKVDGHLARNFTVCYSARYHCPVWVAAPLHACYVGDSGDRNYGRDPVVPGSIQPSDRSIASPYNKGHLLGNRERSGDSGMNKQVSYFTNMTPQHAADFNTGGGAWNNLEDYIDKMWCSDTLYMVSGCHFETWTDTYGNTASPKTTNFGGVPAGVPTMFYYVLLRTKSGNSGKPVLNCSANELQCVGFVISHAMPKGHKPATTDMRSVEWIENFTGFKFFTNVPNAPKGTYNPTEWGFKP